MFTAHSIQKILNVPGPIQCKLNHIQMGHHPVLLMSRMVKVWPPFKYI